MIGVLGISHKSAPVNIREKLAFAADELDAVSEALIGTGFFKELVFLSTCNRSEVYFVANEICSAGAAKNIKRVLAETKGIDGNLDPYLFQKFHTDAVKHLFSVVAGLDSMILGEYQIVSQVKGAYNDADARGAVGKVFHRLFTKALECSKQVRVETPFNRGAHSVSYAAVTKCAELFPDLTERNILIIGAGDTGELVLRNFAKKGCRNITISNRTEEKAVELAQSFGARVLPFGDMFNGIHDAEIIVSSISCKEPLLDAARVMPAMNGHEKVVMIDLGVPRNIDDDVSTIPSVTLFNVDDLEEVVVMNEERKQEYISVAQDIVDRKVEEFGQWLDEQSLSPAISSINKRIVAILDDELTAVKGMISEDEYLKLEKYNRFIARKLKNKFVKRLKELTDNGRKSEYVSIINLLFDEENDEQN